MEQQRILIIIVSVSLFVAVVIGAALLLTYPRDEQDMAQAPSDAPESAERFDPIEYLNQPDQEAPAFEPEDEEPRDAESGDVVIVYGQSEEGGRPSDRPADEQGRRAAEPSRQQKQQPAAERQTQPRPAEKQEQAASAGTAERAPAPERSAEQAAAERAAEPARTAQRSGTQAAAERRGRTGTNYWIQVISSPNLGLVRNAQESLDENRLGSRITTTSVEGTNYFRLRVGPYSSKNEARKFLGWVKRIDGFEGSYISETYFRM